jgi:general secretion pathway protein N
MKKRHYLLIAVTAYLLFLVVSVPAYIIEKPVNNNTPLRIQAVSGSLWNGQAGSVRYNDIELEHTRWDISLWKIITGRISANIKTELNHQPVNAQVGSTFLGSVFVNDLKGLIAASDVARYANIPLAQLGGTFRLSIDHADWNPGDIPLANGVIEWNQASVTVADSASLGNVKIVLSAPDDTLNAKLSNTGGDISVKGDAQLTAEANYKLDLTLTPDRRAKPNIRQSLGMFAKRGPGGSYLLNKSGSLKDYM